MGRAVPNVRGSLREGTEMEEASPARGMAYAIKAALIARRIFMLLNTNKGPKDTASVLCPLAKPACPRWTWEAGRVIPLGRGVE